jgi:translation elongation factor EF-Tu-like GTPase
LEELELRELLNTYALPGDTVRCFHDSKLRSVDAAHGIIGGVPEITEWLDRQPPRSRTALPASQAVEISAEIYLMTREESEFARMLADGDVVQIFVNGQLRDGVAKTSVELPPGSSSQAVFQLRQSAHCASGSRFLIIVDNHVVGCGTTVQIDL